LFVNLVKQTLKIPKPEGFQICASFSQALVVAELIELFPTAQKLQNLSFMLQFFLHILVLCSKDGHKTTCGKSACNTLFSPGLVLRLVFIKPCSHLQRLRGNAGNSNTHYILALATLGGTTEIGSFLFVLRHPKWPRQVSSDCP
jgi:hypothetical protein